MEEIPEKRKKFVDLAERRVNRASTAIRSIGNLANKTNYVYTDDDAKAILRELHKAVAEVKERFNGNARKESSFSLKP